jgi:hypothetical protein
LTLYREGKAGVSAELVAVRGGSIWEGVCFVQTLYTDYVPANRLRREVNYIYKAPMNPSPASAQTAPSTQLQNINLWLGIGAGAVTILGFIFGRNE